MYENYIFDLYGTLVDIRTDEEEPYLWEKMSEIYRALGAEYAPDELKQTFRETEREEKRRMAAEAGYGDGGLLAEEQVFASAPSAARRAQVPKALTGIPTADGNAGNREMQLVDTNVQVRDEEREVDLTSVFAMLYQKKGVSCSSELAKITAVTFRALSRKRLQLYDGVIDLLEELKRRKKRIYLLSNAQTDFTRPEISMLGLTKYFDEIFISSEQGVKKPSPLFFQKLLTACDIEPAESVMIGNDELADIAGAKEVGMDSLYIHTDISPQDTGKVEPTYRIMDGDFRKIRGLVLQ